MKTGLGVAALLAAGLLAPGIAEARGYRNGTVVTPFGSFNTNSPEYRMAGGDPIMAEQIREQMMMQRMYQQQMQQQMKMQQQYEREFQQKMKDPKFRAQVEEQARAFAAAQAQHSTKKKKKRGKTGSAVAPAASSSTSTTTTPADTTSK